MSVRRSSLLITTAAAFATGLTLLAACTQPRGYPTQTITLCGKGCVNGSVPSDMVNMFAGGPFTYSWGGIDQLSPPIMDGAGAAQKITWDPAFTSQEVIAFDLNYSDALPPAACAPADCYAPVQGLTFTSLLGKGMATPNPLTKDMPSTPIAHVVHYDHGSCRLNQAWVPIFNTISSQILTGLKCAEQCLPSGVSLNAEELVFDEFQPHFVSLGDDIRHGFEFDAHYTMFANAGPAIAFPDVQVNPAYTFAVDALTGLLDVIPIQERVVVLNDTPNNDVKTTLQTALATILPQALESQIASALTVTPPAPFQISCNPSASVTIQQASCFNAVTTTMNGPSIAFQLFQGAFLLQNLSAVAAVSQANSAVSGLENRNFACAPVSAGSSSGTCVFHPVFKRVNVLPDEFEFVLSETLNDAPANALYSALGTLAVSSGQLPPGFPANFCGNPVVRTPDGPMAYASHANVPATMPPSPFVCPACP